ncbi:MFS transporter [Bacillus weihaiensis]|uniref:MFS transporter n=1 Tax=Bacillus weihaiensis TaxID=1547283 RepID=A0A1L3MRE0_9BACI|nr:MFS transporter [Bacillus weihaiensis]APH04901.1 MFS transporter [Bacillus weihaiensis]
MEKQRSPYRWVVFGTVLFTYFLIVSQRTAPGLITDQLMKDFQVSAATIGLLTSIQFLAYAGLQIPIGILSDRFGPNVFLITGTLLNGMGTILYSVSSTEILLIIARSLVGVGDATIWINLVLILSQWFKAGEFLKLLGFAGISGSLGFLMATVPFSIWIGLFGWRIPFFAVGSILCVTSLVLYFVLVYFPNRKLPPNKEEEKKQSGKREKTWSILRRVFSTRQAWATFFCHFGLVGTYVGFIGSWAVPYGMEIYELSRSDASQLVMIGLFGVLIGAFVTSTLSSRLPSVKRPYMFVHTVVFLCWTLLLIFEGKPPYLLGILLFFFIGYGNGASSMTFAVVRQSFPVTEVGVVSGFANMGGFLSAVMLPSLFGKVLDSFPPSLISTGYTIGFIIPIIFSLLGLMGAILIKEEMTEITQRKQAANL